MLSSLLSLAAFLVRAASCSLGLKSFLDNFLPASGARIRDLGVFRMSGSSCSEVCNVSTLDIVDVVFTALLTRVMSWKYCMSGSVMDLRIRCSLSLTGDRAPSPVSPHSDCRRGEAELPGSWVSVLLGVAVVVVLVASAVMLMLLLGTRW